MPGPRPPVPPGDPNPDHRPAEVGSGVDSARSPVGPGGHPIPRPGRPEVRTVARAGTHPVARRARTTPPRVPGGPGVEGTVGAVGAVGSVVGAAGPAGPVGGAVPRPDRLPAVPLHRPLRHVRRPRHDGSQPRTDRRCPVARRIPGRPAHRSGPVRRDPPRGVASTPRAPAPVPGGEGTCAYH